MTAPCLERLIEICEHRSFGPGVRKIHITPRRMNSHRIEYLVRSHNRLLKRAGSQDMKLLEADLVVRRCMDRYKDEEALEKEGGAIDLLTQALRALKSWRHDVELSIMPAERHHDVAVFLGGDRYEPHEHNATNFSLTSTLQPCLEATRISKMGLCKLDVSVVRCSYNNDKELDFNLDNFSDEEMKRFSTLRVLTFELTRSISDETKRSMATIVARACELEALHLSHGNIYYNALDANIQFELGDTALQSVKSDKIRSVSLTEMMFSEQCLLEFLRLHRNTLKSLRLTHCALRHGSWHGVISYMQESLPHLSTLNIERLLDVASNASYSLAILGFGRKGKEWVQGEEKVQAALSAIIERPLKDPLVLPKKALENQAYLDAIIRLMGPRVYRAGDGGRPR